MTRIAVADRPAIVARIKSGEKFQAVADDFGVSRQRIHQLWRKYGDNVRSRRYRYVTCRCGAAYPAITGHKAHLAEGNHEAEMKLRWERMFWARVRPDSAGCWIWMGSRTPAGYGTVGTGAAERNGGTLYAHRYSYEMANGPIPDGLVMDHLCRVPPCVNPDHLEAVTHQENIRRGKIVALRHLHALGPRTTHCKRGHERATNSWANGQCRVCGNEKQRERYAARKVAA